MTNEPLLRSYWIAKRVARKPVKRREQPVTPSPDGIISEQQRKRADAPRPLETAEHGIIGVGRHLAAEIGLRRQNGANWLQGLAERQYIRLAIGADRLQRRAQALLSRLAEVSAVFILQVRENVGDYQPQNSAD